MSTSSSSVNRKLKGSGNIQKFLLYVFVVVLLLVAGGWLAVHFYAMGPGDRDFGNGPTVAYLIFPLIFTIHLWLLRRFVKKSMHTSSSKDEALDREDDPGNPTSVMLRLVEFDFKATSQEAENTREVLIKKNETAVWRTWPLLFLACLLYLILDGMGLFIYVAFYFLIITIGPFLYRNKYRAKGKKFGYLDVVPMFKFPVTILKALFSPAYFAFIGLLFVLFIYNDAVNIYKVQSAGLYWAILIHIGIIIYLWAYPRFKPYSGTNIKLLVLRVFGSSERSKFTFNRLMQFWRLFGTHMTIDDTGYARYRYRFWQYRTIWLFMGILFLGMVPQWYVPMVLLIVIIAYDWIGLYLRRPAADTVKIRDRINRALSHPRPSGLFFRDLRMISFMNTWKIVVPEFVERADVVLMDLRGYSPKRLGVNWEINFIFDHKDLDRIIFVRDHKSNKMEVHKFIRRAWAKLEEGSPNEDLKNPVARIFLTKSQEGDDVQALIDALLAAAHNKGSYEKP